MCAALRLCCMVVLAACAGRAPRHWRRWTGAQRGMYRDMMVRTGNASGGTKRGPRSHLVLRALVLAARAGRAPGRQIMVVS